MNCQGMDIKILDKLAKDPKSVLVEVLQRKNRQDGERKNERERECKEFDSHDYGGWQV